MLFHEWNARCIRGGMFERRGKEAALTHQTHEARNNIWRQMKGKQQLAAAMQGRERLGGGDEQGSPC